MTQVLRINNLNKNFDFKPILTDINLETNKSEIIQLSGLNGAGKTTLLKIIAGILKPENGEVFIFDKNLLSKECKAKKHILYWGHQPMVYPNLTTYENIQFFLKIRNQNIPKDIDLILDKVNLLELKNTLCEKFSQGMFQRFNLLRFILSKWDLGLMDEPFNGFDSNGKELLLEMIKIWQNKGRSILITAHNNNQLKPLLTSIYEINNTKLIKI